MDSDKEPSPIETARLSLRPVEPADLDSVHAVFASNPEFLEFRPEIATDRGYDLTSVRRYVDGARLEIGRQLLAVSDRKTGEVLGIVDFVIESPIDGMPWIGLVVIHRSQQRRGLGSEAVRAVASHLASRGHRAVRGAVVAANRAAISFAHSLGFQVFGTAAAGEIEGGVALMELGISVGET